MKKTNLAFHELGTDRPTSTLGFARPTALGNEEGARGFGHVGEQAQHKMDTEHKVAQILAAVGGIVVAVKQLHQQIQKLTLVECICCKI